MTIGKLSPRRRGRPFADPNGPKSVSVTFRIRPELKKQLEEMAEVTGRSLSSEIEALLEMAVNPESNVAKYMDEAFVRARDNYAEQAKSHREDMEKDFKQRILNISESAIKRTEEQIEELRKQVAEAAKRLPLN